MSYRLRLLKAATALLYLGPLLAGLAGFGWGVVAAFVLIFLLWQFILRPRQWPQRLSDWTRPEALIALLTQAVTQALLVAVSFGIGRGIGGVLGVRPPLPLLLPVAISFLAIPLSRMLWNPWQPDLAERSLDEELARLEGGAGVPAASRRAEAEAAARMVAALQHLPQGAADDLLQDHLAAMSTQAGPDMLRAALMDPIYAGSAGPLHLRAAVLHATDGATIDALAGSSYAMALFRQLTDADLLVLFARRCTALLAENTARLIDCPDPEVVEAMAVQVPGAAKALTVLFRALAAARSP